MVYHYQDNFSLSRQFFDSKSGNPIFIKFNPVFFQELEWDIIVPNSMFWYLIANFVRNLTVAILKIFFKVQKNN